MTKKFILKTFIIACAIYDVLGMIWKLFGPDIILRNAGRFGIINLNVPDAYRSIGIMIAVVVFLSWIGFLVCKYLSKIDYDSLGEWAEDYED